MKPFIKRWPFSKTKHPPLYASGAKLTTEDAEYEAYLAGIIEEFRIKQKYGIASWWKIRDKDKCFVFCRRIDPNDSSALILSTVLIHIAGELSQRGVSIPQMLRLIKIGDEHKDNYNNNKAI